MDNVVSHATLSALVNRPDATVSLETENKLRLSLGLHPLYAPAIPCPTCGEVHAIDDCHGQPGTVAWRKPPQDTRKRRRTDTTKYKNLTNDDIHRILSEANTPPDDYNGGKLALVRVWDMDECEEIALGEYQPKHKPPTG